MESISVDELCESLDHLVYSMQGMTSAVDGVRKRIIKEWINHEPVGKPYGNPPIILSQPLTKEQVINMLSQYALNIQGDSNSLKAIAEEIRRHNGSSNIK